MPGFQNDLHGSGEKLVRSGLGVKKLEEYNALAAQREDVPHMPSVVVVIDELADLMTEAADLPEPVVPAISRWGSLAMSPTMFRLLMSRPMRGPRRCDPRPRHHPV